MNGYWLLLNDNWVEVTKERYMAEERKAGFHGSPGEPATAGFLGPNGECGSTLGPKEKRGVDGARGGTGMEEERRPDTA